MVMNAAEDEDTYRCGAGQWCSEPVLWTTWEYQGSLCSDSAGSSLALADQDFIAVVKKAPEGACGRPRVRQAVRQGDEQQFRRAIGFAGAVFAAGRTRGGLATETSGLDKKNSHFDELWCAGYIGCYCSYFYMLGVGCRFGASPIVYRYDDWSNTAPLQMVEFYPILFACHLNIGLFGFGSL